MKKKIIIGCGIFISIIILFLMYCRYVGTKGLIIKEYLVKDANLPSSFYGIKIVHLSDIHYGQITNKQELDKVVKKINNIKPDIIVLTGDLLDKDINYNNQDIENIINSLNSMNASIAKFIISGNHDLVKLDNYTKILEKINFTNLDDNYQIIYNKSSEPILISGISTMDNKKNIDEKVSEVNKILTNKDNNIKYNILLIHEPDVIKMFNYSSFNLILAGHSHGGQIRLPLFGPIIRSKNAKKYYEEYYNLNNSKLFISSGIGTSHLKFRFLNKPSINLYRLVNK